MNKKILSFIFAVIIISAFATVSVFAWDYNNTQTGEYGSSNYKAVLQVNDAVELNAWGNGTNSNTSTVLRVAITAGAEYINGGTASAWDNGYGWMGNPGHATAYTTLSSSCNYAYAEYHFHENGVYYLTVGDCWMNPN